jgi:hypothetical protein
LLPTVLPFTLRVKVLDDPLVPSAQRTTQAVPRRLAPPVGCVMKTFTAELLGDEGGDEGFDGAGAGGGADALLPVTVTVLVALPTLPVASRTVTVKVRRPFAMPDHGIVTGPREDVVRLPSFTPFTLRKKLLDDPLVPSTQITAVPLPATVAPFFGCVMNTRSGPLEAGGAGEGDGDGAGDPDAVAEPLSTRCVVSPATVKFAFVVKLPAAVGRKRTTTAWLAPAASENDPPETIENGALTLADPVTAPPLVFCTVKVRSAVAPVLRFPKETVDVGVTVTSPRATPLAVAEQPLSLPERSTAVIRTK